MISDFWKYNGYIWVTLYIYKSEIMIYNEEKKSKWGKYTPKMLYFWNLWYIVEAYVSKKIFLPKFLFSPIIKSFVFSKKLETLIHTSLISARSENQSVSEVFCDKDSESRQFQSRYLPETVSV